MYQKKADSPIFSGRFVGSYIRQGGNRNGSYIPDKEIMQIEVSSRKRKYLLEADPVTIGSFRYSLGDVVDFNVRISSYGSPKLVPLNVRKSNLAEPCEINDIDICDVYAGCVSSEEGKSSVHQVYFTQSNGAKILVRTTVPADYRLALAPYDKCLYEFSLTSAQGQTVVYARSLRPVNVAKFDITFEDVVNDSDDSDFSGSESEFKE